MKSQSKQMDIHVHFGEANKVITRYFGSQFLGHATANDMAKHFEEQWTSCFKPFLRT